MGTAPLEVTVQVRTHYRYAEDRLRAIVVDVDTFNPEVREDVVAAVESWRLAVQHPWRLQWWTALAAAGVLDVIENARA